MKITHRLSDPLDVAPNILPELQKKLSRSMGYLARGSSASPPGNPFVFAFTAERPHYLFSTEDEEHKTCFANGESFQWHPDYLLALSPQQIGTVIEKITYHMVCGHYSQVRLSGKVPLIWNWACSLVICGTIENDYNVKGKIDTRYQNFTEHPLWNGEFGTPITLQELLDAMESKPLPAHKQGKDKYIMADMGCYERSVDDVYHQLIKQAEQYMPELLKTNPNPPGDLQFVSDIHDQIEMKVDQERILQDAMRAGETAEKMRGEIPTGIREQLGELLNPTMTWEDFAAKTITNKKQEKGIRNDWTAPKKRGMVAGVYMPKKQSPFIRILCGLDTSGSMSQYDMTHGISQLQVLDHKAEITVVPMDAQCYWNDSFIVKSNKDLPKIEAVGRGGTVFDDFFNGYRKFFKKKFDLIVVITDGFFGNIEAPTPHCDTLWIITHAHVDSISLPFGRAFPLVTKFNRQI